MSKQCPETRPALISTKSVGLSPRWARYGKTAYGLAKDWKVSLEEAQETVDRWYADRPEVRSPATELPWPARKGGVLNQVLSIANHRFRLSIVGRRSFSFECYLLKFHI